MNVRLITTENTKTKKGEKLNYMTGIIYMLPDARTCPFASIAGCGDVCIVHSGNARFANVNTGRGKRTIYFYTNQQSYMEQLFAEIKLFEINAKNKGMIPIIRLNGTSDIQYEDIPVLGYSNIFAAFPHIQFYDYTKIVSRFKKQLPSNYDLTFSYSATEKYQSSVNKALELNARMSVVFAKTLPTTFMGKKVIDGDEHDLRFNEPRDVIVGLKFKRPTTKKVDVSQFPFVVQ